MAIYYCMLQVFSLFSMRCFVWCLISRICLESVTLHTYLLFVKHVLCESCPGSFSYSYQYFSSLLIDFSVALYIILLWKQFPFKELSLFFLALQLQVGLICAVGLFVIFLLWFFIIIFIIFFRATVADFCCVFVEYRL